MAVEIPREQFLARVGDLARMSGKHPADLALTVAAMLAATKVCPSPQGSDPGFLDQSHELTKGEWGLMLSIMSARSTTEARGTKNPFYLAGEKMPEAPGMLEHLRRLVLASQGDVTHSREFTIPSWLLFSVLDLARSAPYAAGGLDSALPSVLSEIIDSKKSARVFCAYDATVEVAVFLAAKGMRVALDLQSPELAGLCSFLAVAADLPLQIRQGDPFALAQEDMRTKREPSYDIAIVNPPFNMRSAAMTEDGLGTTLPAPLNSEASGVILALARGRDAAVCLLPPSFLFQASKANQAFKARAVYDYGLDAVVTLPLGSLHGIPVSPALVIFRPVATKRRDIPLEKVFMVDARGYRPRAGSDLALPEGFGASIREHTPSEISCLVPISEIEANDFVLLPERYVLSPEARRGRELTSASKTVALDDIVELYRPQAMRGPKETGLAHDTLFEVGVADIDEVGLVRNPSKQVSVTPEAALQARKARLEPGDVLLVIKGSAGKVGFLREIPESPSWLAGQSFVILRLRRHAPISDPRVLFRYLTSSLGQGMLQSLRVGVTVPGLQMADVRRLPIAVPPLEEQAKIGRDVEELFAIQDQIASLRTTLAERQRLIWPEIYP